MKERTFVFVLFVVIFTLGLFGCKDVLAGLGEDDGPPEREVLSPDDFLILSHLDPHPVRDKEEVTTIVNDFLYVVGFTGSGAHPVITGKPETRNIPIGVGFAVKSPDTGEESIPASSTLPFYRYTIVDTATGTPGSVIASGDKRIGNIIAYVEQETEEDNALITPFMEMFLDNLTAYVERTIETYNSVTPEQIEAAQLRANATGRQASKTSSERQASRTSNDAFSVNREVVDITRTTFPPLVQSRWNQGLGYWNVLNSVKGTTDLYVGSVAVAMGQLMAYHKWPRVCSLNGTFNDPFNANTPTNFELFPYDWNAMNAKPGINDGGMSAVGKRGINVLLYEAGVRAGVQWNAGNHPPTNMENVVNALKVMGYDVSQSGPMSYNFATIVTSINDKQPVIVGANTYTYDEQRTRRWIETTYFWFDIFGWFPQTETFSETYMVTLYKGGHTWVIDDYEIWYHEEPGSLGTDPKTWPEFLVHCNLGWGGDKTGWYTSAVFDTNREVYDEQRSVSGTSLGIQRSVQEGYGYYAYNMQIIPFLKPNR
jgi:hypothetical protein